MSDGQPPIALQYEGDLLGHNSLACVNRSLVTALARRNDLDLRLLHAPGRDTGGPLPDRFRTLEPRLTASPHAEADVWVRDRLIGRGDPPPSGRWVTWQPWEFGSVPRSWLPFLARLDEVWAPTGFVRQCYLDAGFDPDRVAVVPHGVDVELFSPAGPAFPLPTTRSFRFLFAATAIWRKGIDVLLDAYCRAFRRDDDVCLVIKDHPLYHEAEQVKAIERCRADEHAPEILHLPTFFQDRALAALYRACHCLVHPYRGEGFGLTVAEAAASGLPAIVTAGGACDDFAPPQVCYRIPSKRLTVELIEETVGTAWVLQPSPIALAEILRAAYRNPEEVRARGVRARAHIAEHFTWDAAAEQIAGRCRGLRERPVRRRPT